MEVQEVSDSDSPVIASDIQMRKLIYENAIQNSLTLAQPSTSEVELFGPVALSGG